jgi:hypothetical protein
MRRRFSIIEFLNKHNIPYIEGGVNVKRGEVNIRCPFCIDDPSAHLGVDEQRQIFSCWRNPRHRGRLVKLIMVLGRISYSQACALLGQNDHWFDGGAFSNFIANPEAFFEADKIKIKTLPKYPFKDYNVKIPRLFVDYLISRGFYYKHIPDLFNEYSIRYCVEGLYRDRLVIPVTLRGEQVTFTTRSISDGIRYLSLSEKDGALLSIKETVWNFDNLLDYGGEILFLCEGPLDALKLDYYGKKIGGRATCLFGKNIKMEQILLLSELVERFNKVVLLLDRTEFDSMLRMERLVSFLKKPVVIGELPDGVKDPGELSIIQVRNLVRKYL